MSEQATLDELLDKLPEIRKRHEEALTDSMNVIAYGISVEAMNTLLAIIDALLAERETIQAIGELSGKSNVPEMTDDFRRKFTKAYLGLPDHVIEAAITYRNGVAALRDEFDRVASAPDAGAERGEGE